MSNLGIEITRLIERSHPRAFTGDMKDLTAATCAVADTLGCMFALIRREAPNDATAQAAMKMMLARVFQSTKGVEREADRLRARAVSPPSTPQ